MQDTSKLQAIVSAFGKIQLALLSIVSAADAAGFGSGLPGLHQALSGPELDGIEEDAKRQVIMAFGESYKLLCPEASDLIDEALAVAEYMLEIGKFSPKPVVPTPDPTPAPAPVVPPSA